MNIQGVREALARAKRAAGQFDPTEDDSVRITRDPSHSLIQAVEGLTEIVEALSHQINRVDAIGKQTR